MAAIPSNISSITSAATTLGNLILVTPGNTVGYQPQTIQNPDGTFPPQPPTLVFNYEGENVVDLVSDITDHFVEDNTAIQDQIALKPEEIRTEGFIGELNDIAPSILAPLAATASKLTVISGFTPQLSTTALLAYNEALFLYQTAQNLASSAVSTWSSLTDSGGESVIDGSGITPSTSTQNKQQQFFNQFYGYWRNRTLFTVQTPWAVFTNMAIKTLHAVQDEQTQVVTSFTVTFKMVRFAETIITENLGQGRQISQGAVLENLGVQSPTPSTNVLTQISASGLA